MAKVILQARLEESTHKKLKTIADKELRSLNAQLEYFILQGINNYESSQKNINTSAPLEK